MPTYAYRCTACSHAFDVFQKFTEEPLTDCPACGSLLRKVFQPVGIVFKGSGWYINDSRKPEAGADKGDTKAGTDNPETKVAARNGSATTEASAPAPVASETKVKAPSETAKAAAD